MKNIKAIKEKVSRVAAPWGYLFITLLLAAFLNLCVAPPLSCAETITAEAAVKAEKKEGVKVGVKERAAPVEAVRLDDLIKEAREKSPVVRAAKLAWESVREKHRLATALDDPMVTYVQPIEEVETRLGPQERVIGLSQKIPFPGKRRLKGKIVNREIAIARGEYEKALREVTAGIKKAYYELYYVDSVLALARENSAVLDYFAEVSRTNYGLSVSRLDELIRARKLSAGASLDLIRLDDMRSNVVSWLNTLLYRPPGSDIGTTVEPWLTTFGPSLDDLLKWGRENYEELAIAGLKVEKGDLEERLARYASLPHFRVGVNYTQIGEPAAAMARGGDDAYAVTFGMNLPLWFSKNRAEVRRARLNRERSFTEKNAVEKELENRIKRIYFNLSNAERIVKLYGESLIPGAKESLELAEARYKSGEEMLGGLLETQSMWINFRLVYFRALADYFIHIAELERLTARKLYEQ